MSKINKILSKKIKFPLSLRGLFPFCHSRESGNPSSLSLQGAKRRSNLNHNGFTLIELMIAVAILALAVFGIFHAYSVGFLGMADARDRTVATNYAREAMEDVKNMDFDQIITQSRNYIDGTKYEREVIVQESTNLKKVTTKVYWRDRNGNTKKVEANMLVHFIETTAGDATKIILFANPYAVLTENITDDPEIVDERESIITAVVKDDKGNTVTAPEYDISFSITLVSESAGGGLSPINKTTINGKATTTFASSSGEGEVTITASATGLTSDSIIIKITDPEKPVKINLTANPIFMTASESSTSIITATILNAGGAKVTEESKQVEITFSISGPGNLSTPTTIPTSDGVAPITLTSNGTPGTITVTASASELEPGVVDVITGGKIYLSASSINVPVNEKSVITVTTKDVNDVPIKYNGTINLSLSPEGYGTLSLNYVTFNGTTFSETVVFTADSEGTVNINAVDDSLILTQADPITLNIKSALIPHHIEVYANLSSIKAGGEDTSTITARIKTEDGITVTSYTDLIVFITTEGTFPNVEKEINTNDIVNVTYEDGVAIVKLYPSSTYGNAEINVYSPSIEAPSITGSTEVGFYVEADHIELVADPQNISVGGETCTVIATIYDDKIIVSGYTGSILFEIIEGHPQIIKFSFTNKKNTIVTITEEHHGEVKIKLIPQSVAGTARIKTTSSFTDKFGNSKEIEGYLNIPVGITLILVEDSISYLDNTVSFNIDVQGAELLLEEMRVSWDPSSETLNEIEIKSPYTAGSITIFDNSDFPAFSGDIINVDDIILSTGESNVKIYFNQDIFGKNILDVTFNPNSGDYTVNLIP